MLGDLEGGLYGAAQSVPYTLLAGVPTVGPLLTYSALAASNYNRLMLENRGMDHGAAMVQSLLTAAPQAAIERFQFRLLTAKLLALAETMKAMASARVPTALCLKP